MTEIFSAISKYTFGPKFRFVIFLFLALLVLFHIFVLAVPFVQDKSSITKLNEKQVNHLRTTSNSISNITLALILMVLITEGQKSIHIMMSQKRKKIYAETEDQLINWFEAVQPKTFDFTVKLVNSEPAAYQDTLQNFKVEGSAKKVIELYSYKDEFSVAAEEYCKNVHFEITCYPTEIIYGIHIEFDDYGLNQKIHTNIEQILQLNRQSREFIIDNIIPKKPDWIFITKTIPLEGNEDKDFPKVLTHTRHFVELVGHSYDLLYSKQLIDIYINNKHTSVSDNS